MNCINCGAPINPHIVNCRYCGTYYDTSKFNIFKSQEIRKKAIYPASLIFGVLMVLAIYLVFFDNFSETELVQITPVWYFAIVFGLYGYKAESLVNDIITGKTKNFKTAYHNWTTKLYKHNIITAIIMSILFFPFSIFKKISPLITALTAALIWGLILAVFFSAIFPNL
jgi:uncharacterized membrane protein